MPKRSVVFAKFHSKNMPTLNEEEYDKVIGIIAKDEAAQAEAARIALIEAKNAELDQKLAAIADKNSKTLKAVTDALTLVEKVPEDEKDFEAITAAIEARKEVIEIIATECASIEAAHIEENADVYNPQGAG